MPSVEGAFRDAYESAQDAVRQMNNRELGEFLEGLVDIKSFTSLLLILSDVAGDKALHLEGAWQDARSSKFYERLASDLERLANKYEGA